MLSFLCLVLQHSGWSLAAASDAPHGLLGFFLFGFFKIEIILWV